MQKYRPEIDGLRAVAVCSVILFHAGVTGFSGGYVGVDVFFVISGFLITSIVLHELEHDSYSVASFYERRIRRIFPPLFAMLAVTLHAGYKTLLPEEFLPLARSLFEATLFRANVGFWADSGYFAPAAESKPLLHTWSLCVEEQFYLVFPLLLTLVWRKARRYVPIVIAGLLLVSFGAAALRVSKFPESAFFLAKLRAWELLIGALAAAGGIPRVERPALKFALSAVGVALIVYAVATFDQGTVFPGPSALLPTVGTLLVIHGETSGQTWVGRALGMRGPVAIGLISYALYLWHWPILVFAKIWLHGPLTPLQVTFALTATAALAIASRYLLEEPVRKRRVLRSRDSVYGLAGVTMIGACLLTYPVIVEAGLPDRVPWAARKLMKAARNSAEQLEKVCLPNSRLQHEKLKGLLQCDVGKADAEPSILVWSDSHGQAFAPAIDQVAKNLGRRVTVVTHGGCPPALEVGKANRGRHCNDFHRHAKWILERGKAFDTVILIGHWAEWVERERFEGAFKTAIRDNDEVASDPASAVRVMERGLDNTLKYLEGRKKHVILVGSVPEIGCNVPHTLARARWLGWSADIGPTAAADLGRQAPIRGIFDRLATRHSFQRYEPHDVLCASGRCTVARAEEPIYLDDHHLIRNAAPLITPSLQSAVQAFEH